MATENWSRFALCTICLLLAPVVAGWVGSRFTYVRRIEPTEIYQGVRYQLFHGPRGGAIHLVEIDLSRPGIELFVTPVDRISRSRGYDYRLDYVRNVARSQGLAVAVNGAVFAADSYLTPMAGDFASGVDTMISDGAISHLFANTHLLWFDERLKPHIEMSKPPSSEVLRRAKWAVGSRSVVLRDGIPFRPGVPEKLDNRVLIGIDEHTSRMWIGVFESCTTVEAAESLSSAGAKSAVLLDGGDSTSFYLGGRARGIPGGLRFGGHLPVATIVGVRADPIIDPL